MAEVINFPTSLDDSSTLPLIVDLLTEVKASVINKHRSVLLALESEIGPNASGTFTTVASRLDSIESSIGSGGGSGSITVNEDGSTVQEQVTQINFTGDVSLTAGAPHSVTVNISGNAVQKQESISVSSGGQTSFTLTETPLQSSSTLMFVNGIKQLYGTDYSVSGTSVTYAGVSLLTTDKVEFWYLIALSTGDTPVAEQVALFGNVTLTKTADYDAVIGDFIKCDPSALGFTVNLPTASGKTGQVIYVKNITSSVNDITIMPDGAETIDEASSVIIDVGYMSLTLISDGSNWWIS